VAILLHALAALMFGDFRLPAFLQRAHMNLPVSRSAMQALEALWRNRSFIYPRGSLELRAPVRRARRV
jgi:hypothetical protein